MKDSEFRAEVGWPRVSFEEPDWRDSWRRYKAAVVPAIAGLDVVGQLSPGVIADVASAQQRVSDFDRQLTERFGIRDLGTISTVLMRTESASSSQIEHITASARQLALAEIGESRSSNAKLVTNNLRAMASALTLAQAVDVSALVAMHEALMEDTDPRPGLRGEHVWIGVSGSSPIGADFIPPHHTRVADALADLVRFVGQTSGLPLAKAAVAHAQFETIHPFVDGNGRVGRALVHAMLRRDGVAEHLTVPVSAGLLADTRGYIEALGAYRQGEVEPIVAQFARAAHRSVEVGAELLERLSAVQADWRTRVNARSDSVVWRLIDALASSPAVTARLVMERDQVSRPAALAGIQLLVDAGILRKVSTGKRNQVWVATEATEVFDRVAEMVGRRRAF